MFLFLIGFAGILPDSVSLFFDLLTVYFLTLILLNQENKENKNMWYVGCGLSLGLAMTMRITNIALLFVVFLVLSFLRELRNDKFDLWGNEQFHKEILKFFSFFIRKITEIRKEEAISVLLFVGGFFIGFLPELLLKLTTGGSALEIMSGPYLDGTGYYIAIIMTKPWGGNKSFFSTSGYSIRFLNGLKLNYFFIAFLISPFLMYLNTQHLSKVLSVLIFFAFLGFYSFWSYYPLMNLKYLLPAFPFCFISLSASLVKLVDLLISYGKSKGKFLNLNLSS
jgi:4-amino-4-deoxy-L-arabinose transferase-like glycosyltransferase